MVLVMAHAMIIGYVRAEAAKLKTVASQEISLGMYYVPTSDRQWLTQLRMLLAVPPERRLAVKATIEHNRWLVHQAIEEALRQIEPSAFEEPKMTLVKEKIKQVIDESLHEKVVERILICDRFDLPVEQFRHRPSPAGAAPHSSHHAPHAAADAHSHATKLTHAPSKDEHHADHSHSEHPSVPANAAPAPHAHDAHAEADAHSAAKPHSQPAAPEAHAEPTSHSTATEVPHDSGKDQHPAATGHKEPTAAHHADSHTEEKESPGTTPPSRT